MEHALDTITTFAVRELPKLLIPIAILALGWIAAIIAAALTRGAMRRTRLDERIAHRIGGKPGAVKIDMAKWFGNVAYYTVLLLTLLAFLQATDLTDASAPFTEMLGAGFAFIPRVGAAVAILFVGWLLATLVRKSLSAVLDRWGIDHRLARETRGELEHFEATGEPPKPAAPVGQVVAETAYWLTLALFVPAILGALQIDGLLAPFRGLVERVLAFLPNLASAAVIIGVGWLLAKVGARIVSSFLATAGIDRVSTRTGLNGALRGRRLSSILGTVVYAVVLIPVAIGALDALKLDAITRPASRMLGTFFDVLPAILGATVILLIAYAVGRLLSVATTALLEAAGFDNVLRRLGLATSEETPRRYAPSRIVGTLVLIAVMMLASIEGARLLGFDRVADLAADLAVLGGRVLLAGVIFGVSLFLATAAANTIRKSAINQASILATVARIAIVGFGSAIALRQVGLADEIIQLAFGLALGAVAVACALAFGLGGREAAGVAIEQMRRRAFHGNGSRPSRATPASPPALSSAPKSPSSPRDDVSP